MFAPFGFYNASDFNPGEILWITATPTDSDQDSVISELEGLGFTITVVDEGTGPYNPNNYQAVFIHEDVNSGTAWATLDTSTRGNTTAGAVISETALYDEFLNGNAGQSLSGTNTFTITSAGSNHPITKNYVGSIDPGNLTGRCNLMVSGSSLANWDTNSLYPIINVYDIGDNDEGNTPQNGRRVTLPFGNNNGTMNSTGKDIWVRAIQWAAGDTRL